MAKILIVDDEPRIRELIRENLQYSGYTCEEAGDGSAALSLLTGGGYDLVILDLMMPFMDGMQLCEAVSHTMPWVQIVILSGYDDFAYAQQAISLERNRLRIGRRERVLVESVDVDGMAVARSAAEAPETDGVIRVSGACEADIGCFVTARITGADTYDLTGEKL